MFKEIAPYVLKIISEFLALQSSETRQQRKFLKNQKQQIKLIRKRARAFKYLAKKLRKKQITVSEYELLRDALLTTF